MSTTTVEVLTAPAYAVHVGPGLLARVAGAVEGHDRVFLLADERAAALHGAGLGPLERAPRLALPGGEKTKCFARLEQVLEAMAAAGLARGSCLVTLGGGVIGDLGGLAASLFKRGIDVVHAPTTLLAQVDASVGGKTAVDLAAGRNLAGTFHQPLAVYADTLTLATLDDGDWLSGLGEVVKTALIDGEEALAQLEQDAGALLERDPEVAARMVARCVALKARIVAEDPAERGPRRALNLGHTFAHAIEHAAGYGAVPHGVAVAAGLGLALAASRELGRLEDPDLEARVGALLERLGLPSSLAGLRTSTGLTLDPAALLAGLAQDKKAPVGAPELVLPLRAGDLALGVAVSEAQLRGLLA